MFSLPYRDRARRCHILGPTLTAYVPHPGAKAIESNKMTQFLIPIMPL